MVLLGLRNQRSLLRKKCFPNLTHRSPCIRINHWCLNLLTCLSYAIATLCKILALSGLKFNIIKLKLWHQVPSFHVKQKGKGANSDGFYFLGSQINVEGDCSHESKRLLLLWRKAYN